LSELAGALDPARSIVVTDAALRGRYGASFPPCPVIEVPAGEAAKQLSELGRVYEELARAGLDREGTIVAIGGGSVSDLAGFAAATWLRGVDFCAAPTTLLAMVDAALGGKNGVDLGGRKNLVGSWKLPRLVLCDVELLASLPDDEFASGMAEAIKHAVIEGGEHFAFLESECRSRPALDAARLDRLVGLSQAVKLGIVERDPRESGERRLLNLGHTIGHAVESATGLPHGHSVAAGLGAAFALASRRAGARRRGAVEADAARVASLLASWGLPASVSAARELALSRGPAAALASALRDDVAYRGAVAAALVSDKKRSGGVVRFALPEGIARVAIEPVALDELEAFVWEAP
jgi:3-dehydroquinate synthase